MTLSLSSVSLASGVMLSLLSVGVSGHLKQTDGIVWPNVLDGSAQSIYEASFDQSNILQDTAVSFMGALKYGVFGQASDGAVVGNEGWLFTSEELLTTPAFEANIDASTKRISSVLGTLEAKGIRVLPVIIPDKSEIYAEQLGIERPKAVMQRMGRFQAELAAGNVAFVDATNVLETAKLESPVFLKDDTHWSPMGSKAVAKAVAAALADVSLTTTTVTTKAGQSTLYDGDLLSFVPTGNLRSWIGPEQLTIDGYRTDVVTKGGLFDAPEVEVVLVGTSFSARKAFHFEGFLKQALQADILNFAQEGQGPFAPMEAFLASDFLQTNTPKVVIWEIPARYVSKDLQP